MSGSGGSVIRRGSRIEIRRVHLSDIIPMDREIGFHVQNPEHLCYVVDLLRKRTDIEPSPVDLSPPDSHGKYVLEDGNNRLLAAWLAGYSDIMAKVTYPPPNTGDRGSQAEPCL